jgi:predicted HTH domain antitoxin
LFDILNKSYKSIQKLSLAINNRGKTMGISVKLPDMNIKEDEIKLLLAIKLLEEGTVSLGKAAEIAGFSEKAFVEVLVHRGVAPLKYTDLDLDKEMRNV